MTPELHLGSLQSNGRCAGGVAQGHGERQIWYGIIHCRTVLADNFTDVENTLRTIFRRCVECPTTPPSCPQCPEDETCSLKAASCTECASTTCVKIGSLPGQAAEQSSTPVGAIAGGVVGGVAVICVLTYLVYRFCIKRRRSNVQEWVDTPAEKRDQTALHRNERQSTKSVHSMASTVLTENPMSSRLLIYLASRIEHHRIRQQTPSRLSLRYLLAVPPIRQPLLLTSTRTCTSSCLLIFGIRPIRT